MAEGKKVFLYGCLGCLGIIVLLIVIGAIIAGVAWMQAAGEQVEREVATREIPSPAIPSESDSGPLAVPVTGGRVELDLARAEFWVEPLAPGEPMRVEATYDKKSYELTESFEREEGVGWTYRVQFRASGSSWMAGLRQLFGGTPPEARIYLPSDVPLDLIVKIAEGGAKVDLGGMWLTELDIDVEKGGFQIDVDEPLRQPLERLAMRGTMGGIEASRLGNASPKSMDVDFSMGGLVLDLRGQWLNDSDIDIQCSMGGTVLRLPPDAVIIGLPTGKFRSPDDSEIPLPTLRFTTKTSMGELEIIP